MCVVMVVSQACDPLCLLLSQQAVVRGLDRCVVFSLWNVTFGEALLFAATHVVAQVTAG